MLRTTVGLALLMLLGGQHAVAQADMADEAHLTPVVMSVLAEPHPMSGSDARTHLVYETHLTNASPAEWPIAAIEVLGGDDPEHVLLTIEGDEVAAKVVSLADRSALSVLPPGHSALAFLHVPVEPDAAIPANLTHRLTLDLPDGLPDTFRVFAGLSPDAEVLEEVGAHTDIADQEPVVLGPGADQGQTRGRPMDHEALIRLDLEQQEGCVLVSSPLPLLHLAIADPPEAEITRCVLPILKEMVEFTVGEPVTLRFVESF